MSIETSQSMRSKIGRIGTLLRAWSSNHEGKNMRWTRQEQPNQTTRKNTKFSKIVIILWAALILMAAVAIGIKMQFGT